MPDGVLHAGAVVESKTGCGFAFLEQRLDRTKDEAAYSPKFCHFVNSWSETCLLSFHTKCCPSLSLSSNDHLSSHGPKPLLPGSRGTLYHIHWGLHVPHHPNYPVRSGLTFLGLEIRPGQGACLLRTLDLRPGRRAGVPHGVWLNIKIKPTSVSTPTPSPTSPPTPISSASSFLWWNGLSPGWSSSEWSTAFHVSLQCVLRCTARQWLPSFFPCCFLIWLGGGHHTVGHFLQGHYLMPFYQGGNLYFSFSGYISLLFCIFSRPLVRCLIKSPGSL